MEQNFVCMCQKLLAVRVWYEYTKIVGGRIYSRGRERILTNERTLNYYPPPSPPSSSSYRIISSSWEILTGHLRWSRNWIRLCHKEMIC